MFKSTLHQGDYGMWLDKIKDNKDNWEKFIYNNVHVQNK